MKPVPVILLTCLFAAGCGPLGMGELMAKDPAAACTSSDAVAGVKTVILSNIDAPVKSNIATSYRDQIVAGAKLAITKTAVTHVDQQASTLSCSGEATLTWSKNLVARLAAESPGGDWASETVGILYSVRPKSGAGFDYSVESGAAEVASTVQSMVSALYQSDKNDYKTAEATQNAILTVMLRSRVPGAGQPQQPGAQQPDPAAVNREIAAAEAAQRAASEAAASARRR